MKFKYTGDLESYAFRDMVFIAGVSTEVTDEWTITKLSGNPEFSEVKTRKKKVIEDGDSSADTE